VRAGSSQGMVANSNYNLIEIDNRKLLKVFSNSLRLFFLKTGIQNPAFLTLGEKVKISFAQN